jgi:hypothetical protein
MLEKEHRTDEPQNGTPDQQQIKLDAVNVIIGHPERVDKIRIAQVRAYIEERLRGLMTPNEPPSWH